MVEKLVSNRLYSYALVILIGLTTLLTKFYFNGTLYGLDFGLFHPDGTLYTFRTLTWLGHSQQESSNLISSWYAINAEKMDHVVPESLYFDSNPNWELYKYRVLYSIASMPFVYFFGINGMLVVPAIAYIGVLVIVLEMGRFYQKSEVALVLIFLISVSITITRWMFINTTDSLFTFLSAVSTILLLMRSDPSKWLVSQLALLVAMASTRVAIFFWLPVCVWIFLKNRKQAAILGFFALLTFLPLLRANVAGTIGAGSNEGSLVSRIPAFLGDAVKVLVVELGQLVVLDRILLLLLIAAIAGSLFYFENDSSKCFLFLLASSLMMSILNATLGVNFRFELPVLASLAWVLIEISPSRKRIVS